MTHQCEIIILWTEQSDLNSKTQLNTNLKLIQAFMWEAFLCVQTFYTPYQLQIMEDLYSLMGTKTRVIWYIWYIKVAFMWLFFEQQEFGLLLEILMISDRENESDGGRQNQWKQLHDVNFTWEAAIIQKHEGHLCCCMTMFRNKYHFKEKVDR